MYSSLYSVRIMVIGVFSIFSVRLIMKIMVLWLIRFSWILGMCFCFGSVL